MKEFGKVIKEGGAGVTTSSESGHRMPALSPETDRQLAVTPTGELLDLEVLKTENIKDTLHAYQMAKRCNVKRVMAEAVKWGERGARVNSISPGIIITPLMVALLHLISTDRFNQKKIKISHAESFDFHFGPVIIFCCCLITVSPRSQQSFGLYPFGSYISCAARGTGCKYYFVPHAFADEVGGRT